MKLKYGDLILTVIILIFAVLLLLPKSNYYDTVLLEVNGEIIKTFDLETDTEFIYKDKYYNKIVVCDGEVYISESDCPDHSCVHSGAIKNNNKVICCLPNKLILRLENKQAETDVISG